MFGVFGLQSSYTMLGSTIPVDDLVRHAKAGGYGFVALSDENLHALVKLSRSAAKADIRAVYGWRTTVMTDLSETSFLVYVRTQTGYHNLMRLQVLAAKEKHLTIGDLAGHAEGLIVVTDAERSLVDKAIMRDDIREATRLLESYKTMFETFAAGLGLDTFDQEMKVAPTLAKLASSTGVRLVPVHRTSYIGNNQKSVHKAIVQISGKTDSAVGDANQAFMDKGDLETMFQDYPNVFKAASDLVSSITFDLSFPTFDMPQFPLSEGVTSQQYLKSLASVGLAKRLRKTRPKDPKRYHDRLEHELSVIHRMGYDNYMLIVFDIVRHAKQSGIMVGPGRGSAAGSLVAYATGITDVDPVKYDLLFERFLNPDRVSMPDIDMDFPDDRREEVIRYVASVYGVNHIASIVTFGTFAKRSSIRDIARVMGIASDRINGIVQRIVNDDVDPRDRDMAVLVEAANAIEGLPRHTGTHAAGIVLSEQDLHAWIPMQEGPFPFMQSQLEASDLESLGLLKIDFLGIRNLAVIDKVIRILERQGIRINPLDIPYDDGKTYALLSSADTSGVFQLESPGMRAALREMKPSAFEDLVAILALFRPGPMDNIGTYVSRKNGEPYTDIHPVLTPILKSTYGIIVYQEQVMRIASDFAGYSLSEADNFRRAISKKDAGMLEEERERFISKSLSSGRDADDAKTIYEYILKFANYGFNRSHSVAYAMVAYQMAYLKANHFGTFITVLLSSVIGNESLTRDYLTEARRQGFRIVPPDLVAGGSDFICRDKTIIMALASVKTISHATVSKMLDIRDASPFTSFEDVKTRLRGVINERQFEMLIKSGALDALGETRRTMLENKNIGQAGYEAYISDYERRTYPEHTFVELSAMETESLGFTCLYNPVEAYAAIRKKRGYVPLSDVKDHRKKTVLASVRSLREIRTKSGDAMAFAVLDDGITEREVTVFPETYRKYRTLESGELYVFVLSSKAYKDRDSIIVQDVDAFVTS